VTSRSWIIAIVVLGAALRFVPIWFGLPFAQARPDETVALGLAFSVRSGDLNPHFFHWPSLTLYLFAAVHTLMAWVRGAVDGSSNLSFAEMLISARALVATAGSLTVVVVFLTARRMAGTVVGLVAAFFLAVSILHVRDSHFAMTDVLMTLFSTSSLMLVLRALDTGDRSRIAPLTWFTLAGLVGGLAVSTKYNAAALVVAMAAAQFWRPVHLRQSPWQPRTWLPSLVFAAGLILGFVAGTPYSVLDYRTFAADVIFDLTHLSGGHGVDLGRGWVYHLTTTLPYGLGIPVFIAAVFGIVPMARRYPRDTLVLGLFALAFYGAIGSGRTVFFRYVLPLVPLLVVAAAVAVERASEWLAPRTALRVGTCAAIVALLVGGMSLANCIWFDVLMARTDSRVLAAEWLAPRIRPGDTLYDAGTDYTRLAIDDLPHHRWWFDANSESFGHGSGDIPDWLVIYESPLPSYTRTHEAIVKLARTRYFLIQTVAATRSRPGAALYDLQDAFFMPVSRFDEVRRPGPTIRIYKRLEASTTGNNESERGSSR
jgi:hypothetical protein